jgi:predicted nucleic acid-binding protein
MNVLVDTNVVLDVLTKRPLFYDDSLAIFQLADIEGIRGYLSATSMTNIFYLLRKARYSSAETYQMMDELSALFTIVPVSETTIADALALRWKDFEDAVQFVAARENGAAYIISRNTQDFSSGSIDAVTPEDFIQAIADIEK